ncbi:sugar-binding domain-containing protein, partial [Rhizobium ruizarguesonis]
AAPPPSLFHTAATITAQPYPMPLPVLVPSAEERELLPGHQLVRSTLNMRAHADVPLVGIGELGIDGPLCVEGVLEKD